MKFRLMQTGVIGRRYEIEGGMADQRRDLYHRYLETPWPFFESLRALHPK